MDKTSQILPLQWSRHRLRENPRLGIITLAVTLLCVLIVLYALGPSAISLSLILIFVFSLRSILFPQSFLIDHQGWHISTILTGAKAISWDRIETISEKENSIFLHLGKTLEPIRPPRDQEKLADLGRLLEAWNTGWRPEDAYWLEEDNQELQDK